MLIHHYTNIETLALILQSKKIRFNRLDRMDDKEEAQIDAQGIPVGKYTYVSCWTEENKESIPLWHMYGGNEMGVRISLPQDMFKDYSILDGIAGDEESGTELLNLMPQFRQTIIWKIPASEYFGKNYLILPVYSHDIGTFYRQIYYTEDVKAYTSDICKKTYNDDGTYDLELKLYKVGKCKHTRWDFQKESRFVLHIIPTEGELTLFDASQFMKHMIKTMTQGVQPTLEDYYLPLKDDIFDQMVVTLNPSISAGQRVIVETLLNQYAPNAKITESSLTQLVKMK